jgi:hypothetical protein
MKSGNLNFLEPSGTLQACNGTALPFTFGEDCYLHIQDFLDSLKPENRGTMLEELSATSEDLNPEDGTTNTSDTSVTIRQSTGCPVPLNINLHFKSPPSFPEIWRYYPKIA